MTNNPSGVSTATYGSIAETESGERSEQDKRTAEALPMSINENTPKQGTMISSLLQSDDTSAVYDDEGKYIRPIGVKVSPFLWDWDQNRYVVFEYQESELLAGETLPELYSRVCGRRSSLGKPKSSTQPI